METIHAAARNGKANRVRAFLNGGTHVNTRSEAGSTPLHTAATYGKLDVVRLLLQRGANVNARGRYGGTPLHNAVGNGHLDVVRELLRHGAHVNARDSVGATPLHYAASEGHTRIVHALLEAGAKLSYRNISGRTPFNVVTKINTRYALGARAAKNIVNAANKRRVSAMRQTLSRVSVREGRSVRQGIPNSVLNLIATRMRRNRKQQ